MINKLSTLDKGETRDRRNMQQARMGKLFFQNYQNGILIGHFNKIRRQIMQLCYSISEVNCIVNFLGVLKWIVSFFFFLGVRVGVMATTIFVPKMIYKDQV